MQKSENSPLKSPKKVAFFARMTSSREIDRTSPRYEPIIWRHLTKPADYCRVIP